MKVADIVKKTLSKSTLTSAFLAMLFCILAMIYNHGILLIFVLFFLILRINNAYSRFNISVIEVGFLFLLLSELLSTIESEYLYNSLLSIIKLSLVFCLYLIFRHHLNKNYKKAFLAILSLGSYLLILWTLREFLNHIRITTFLGFSELNNLKNFYSPLGVFNNEWASILLVLLPINFIQLLSVRSVEYKLSLLILCGLNVLCIVFSFSRGAYLSLLVMLIILNIGLWKYGKFKKTFSFNIVWIGMLAIMFYLLPQVKSSFLTTISFDKTISQRRSIDGRVSSIKNIQDFLMETPFFGYGQDNYVLATQRNPLPNEDSRFTPRAVNIIFQLIVERGLFGLICYLLFFCVLMAIFYKRLRHESLNRDNKMILIALFSGIFVILLRELTFSSFFVNDYLYFLSFGLVFLMEPYDYDLKFNYRPNSKFIIVVKSLIFFFVLFITVLQLKRNYLISLNNKFIDTFYNGSLDTSIGIIDKALTKDSENIILNKNKAIAISKLAFKITISKDTACIINVSVLDSVRLKDLKELLISILEINNFDDEAYHGLAWISFIENDFKKSQFYLNRAMELNPYKGLYFCSKIIFSDKKKDILTYKNSLSKLLQFNPEFVESKLFQKISVKSPMVSIKAKKQAIASLESRMGNNIILKARYARLIMETNPLRSKKLFEEVTTSLPNLIRPWLYLAYLKELSGGKAFKDPALINRTLALTSQDYLSNVYFGNYYNNTGKNKEAVFYYRQALIEYNELTSKDYKRNTFLSDLATVYNSDIPNDLLYIFKPDIHANEIFSYLESYYKNTNMSEEQAIFENLGYK